MNTQIPEKLTDKIKSVIEFEGCNSMFNERGWQVKELEKLFNQSKSHWIAEVCREVEGLKGKGIRSDIRYLADATLDDVLQLPSLKQD